MDSALTTTCLCLQVQLAPAGTVSCSIPSRMKRPHLKHVLASLVSRSNYPMQFRPFALVTSRVHLSLLEETF